MMCACTHTHTHSPKAYLQSEWEPKHSGVVAVRELGGQWGRVRAAMSKTEALMSPKDSAEAWGEMAQ